jgi:hypothetical protein
MKKFLQYLMFPGLLFSLLTLASYSCSDSGTNPQDKEFVLPDNNLTWQEVGPMLLAKCGSNSGCHNPTDKAAGLDITNYQAVMLHRVQTEFGNEILVIPGSGEGSFLYQILLQTQLGVPRMPLDGPYLNSNNTNGVRIWINEGALFSEE